MTTDNNAVVVHESQSGAMSMKQVADRVNLVHQALEKVLKKGTHYGTVPGCGQKNVLLKPGADVLAMMFRLVPSFEISRTDLENGHREYDITCTMRAQDGSLLGQGVGSASTMEKKYRYRKDERGNKIENEDIADTYNTVLKIAKKRAHIDATLTVTGAADLFTQDLIDEDEPEKEPIRKTVEKPAQPTQVAPAESQEQRGEIVKVEIGEIRSKSGESKKGPWTRFYFKAGDEYYSTFDSKVAEALQSVVGDTVELRIERSDKGNNILGIVSDSQEELPM